VVYDSEEYRKRFGTGRLHDSRTRLSQIIPNSPATPLVSVIVRSMDRPELADTIASLALQTCPRLEILIVDATGGRHRVLPDVPLAGGHSIRLVQSGRPLTRPQAANVGIDAVAGELFSFLDDDDTCDPDHIAALVAAAAAHPGNSSSMAAPI